MRWHSKQQSKIIIWANEHFIYIIGSLICILRKNEFTNIKMKYHNDHIYMHIYSNNLSVAINIKKVLHRIATINGVYDKRLNNNVFEMVKMHRMINNIVETVKILLDNKIEQLQELSKNKNIKFIVHERQ